MYDRINYTAGESYGIAVVKTDGLTQPTWCAGPSAVPGRHLARCKSTRS